MNKCELFYDVILLLSCQGERDRELRFLLLLTATGAQTDAKRPGKPNVRGSFFFLFFFFYYNKDTRQLKSTALGNKKNQINCVPSLFFYFILKVNFIIIQTWTDYTSCIIFSKIRDECLSIEQRISPFTQSWFFERETSSAATPLQNNKTNSNSFRFFFSRTR